MILFPKAKERTSVHCRSCDSSRNPCCEGTGSHKLDMPLSVPPATTKILHKYHDLADAFDKGNEDILPSHHKYDCPINLQTGAEIPFCCIYALSKPELQAFHLSLQKRLIQLSTSPAGAVIIFVKKKDGSLRPCIDYWALNKMTD